jgi:hypothetical protein
MQPNPCRLLFSQYGILRFVGLIYTRCNNHHFIRSTRLRHSQYSHGHTGEVMRRLQLLPAQPRAHDKLRYTGPPPGRPRQLPMTWSWHHMQDEYMAPGPRTPQPTRTHGSTRPSAHASMRTLALQAADMLPLHAGTDGTPQHNHTNTWEGVSLPTQPATTTKATRPQIPATTPTSSNSPHTPLAAQTTTSIPGRAAPSHPPPMLICHTGGPTATSKQAPP